MARMVASLARQAIKKSMAKKVIKDRFDKLEVHSLLIPSIKWDRFHSKIS